MRSVLIGTSGFSYKHWADGVFYPERLPQTKWLAFYAERFPAVELNVTFYRLPSLKAFEGWRDKTPRDFRFVLKGSRFITHIKRLKDIGEQLELFFENASPLKTKTACVLWQLPPSFHLDLDRLKHFLSALTPYRRRLQHAFEFRHESWWCDDTFDLLRKKGMAFSHADFLKKTGDIPDDMPFHYVRFHGAGQRYGGDYPKSALTKWAKRIKGWKKRKLDTYAFFNNDAFGYAIKNAMELKKHLGL